MAHIDGKSMVNAQNADGGRIMLTTTRPGPRGRPGTLTTRSPSRRGAGPGGPELVTTGADNDLPAAN
jgi:hypothetical protein